MKETRPKAFRLRRLLISLLSILVLLAAALVLYARYAHSFLAVTKRVDADVLVVEAWIPYYLLPRVAEEIQRNHYSVLLISGIENENTFNDSHLISATRTKQGLEDLGVPRDTLLICPAPYVQWRRTATSAKAVYDRIQTLEHHPRGINVITEGTHARETWAAYRHIFGNQTPVGIIAVPKGNNFPERWWRHRGNWIWVTKDFLGWLKEVLFPIYS